MFGATYNKAPFIPCILALGQSNADGSAQGERLANTLYNYKGISTSYPGTRTTQEQYATAHTSILIYNKQKGTGFQNWMVDDGAWQTYQLGVNSRNRIASGQSSYFGSEWILAQCIHDRTGGEVAIIKPAFPGTSLSRGGSIEPGQWNPISRTIATEAYIKRAVRDFSAFRPNSRLKIVGVLWWQGEGDAGLTEAQYVAAFEPLYAAVNDTIKQSFVIESAPAWNIVKLDFNRNAAETLINNALSTISTSYPRFHYVTEHTGKSLQKKELTVMQDDPITKGVDDTTPNVLGGLDDEHTNYIGHQIVGEICFNNIDSYGLLNDI